MCIHNIYTYICTYICIYTYKYVSKRSLEEELSDWPLWLDPHLVGVVTVDVTIHARQMSESQCIPYHNMTEFQYILHHWPILLHDNDPHNPCCGRHCAMCPYLHLRMSEFQYILHHDIDLLRRTICTNTHLVGGGVVTERCAQFLSKGVKKKYIQISIYAKIVGCRNFPYAYTLLIYTTTYLQPSAMWSTAPKYAGCESFPYTLIYRTCIDIWRFSHPTYLQPSAMRSTAVHVCRVSEFSIYSYIQNMYRHMKILTLYMPAAQRDVLNRRPRLQGVRVSYILFYIEDIQTYEDSDTLHTCSPARCTQPPSMYTRCESFLYIFLEHI